MTRRAMCSSPPKPPGSRSLGPVVPGSSGCPARAVSGRRPPIVHLAMIFSVISCLPAAVPLTHAAATPDSAGPATTSTSTSTLLRPPPPSPSPLLPLSETLPADSRFPVDEDGQRLIMSAAPGQRLLRTNSHPPQREDIDHLTIRATAPLKASRSPLASRADSQSPLPSPFDGALSANFSDGSDGSCLAFIDKFTADETFKSCYPFSVLMQSSNSFVEAEGSQVAITQVLDATCKADVDSCTTYLDSLADELISDDNCGADFEAQNSVVTQAHTGMKAYKIMYQASCLTDHKSSAYCFARAVTNLTASDDVYPYYLPLNLSLPSGTHPSCDSCNSRTMGLYQAATADRDSPIATTFDSAAAQFNKVCGKDFVNTTLPAAETQPSSAWAIGPPTWLPFLALLASTWARRLF